MFNFSVIIFILAIILILIIAFTGYVKAPPDKAIIISGFRKKPKVLIGKAGIKIPYLERKDELSLQLVSIDVKTQSSVPTADYINIKVDAAVNVKISDNPERLALAAQNFLNKNTEYIRSVAREVLEGNTREIVGRMKLEDMVSDRQKFAEEVRQNAAPDLAKMGLDIIAFNVQNFVDEQEVIENLGIDNISRIKKDAAIAKAEADKDIAKAQAKAKQEANEAQVESDTKIAERDNELAIKKAELKKISDAKKAEADKVYDIQAQERMIELKRKEAEVKEQELDASIKKQAEADRFAAQQKADADLYTRQKEAEAKLYEKQKEMEAKQREADAVQYQMLKEAEGIKAKGEAEAEAVKAKGIAEADALNKKAEAMKKYGQAAMAEMFFNAWPKAIEAAAKPLEKVDKITMYGEGNSSKLIEDIMKSTSQINEGMSDSVGLNLNQMLQSFFNVKAIQTMNDIQANEKTVNDEEKVIQVETTTDGESHDDFDEEDEIDLDEE